MAAQLVTKINRYIGTAAEIAAMTLTGIPTGSTFFESDTGILKVLNAAGALVTAPSESVSLAGSMPAGTNLIGKVGIDQTTPGVTNKVVAELSGSNVPLSGQKNVTTAGTRVPLGTTQKYKEINIIAKDTNTGYIYVGNSTVDSTNGAILPKGGYVTLQFIDIADVYIDSSVNGEGVSWMGVI